MSREIEDGSGWEGMVPQRAEPSYEVMFWQERDACDRIQREMQSKIDDLRMRMDAARGLLVPLGNQVIPSVIAIREALNILR